MSTGNISNSNDVRLKKQRPLSTSFNEISHVNSSVRKDHELHYFKNYSSLTECELSILRKTAFINIRNLFHALNDQQRNIGSTNALNLSSGNPSSPTDKVNNNATTLVNQTTVTGSFSTLNHHSHNTVPGKDLRESILKTLETINRGGRSTKKWKIFTKKDKKKEVFGVPLITSLEYAFVYIDPSENCNNKKIPIVVYECINFLRKNGLRKEGIFRVNGSERRINNSLKVFNEAAGYGFGFDFDGMNVFDAASLLKLYLRQLPEPLIPFCLYSSFLDVIKYIPDTCDKIQAFQYLFMMLPTAHLVLLEILLQFLSEIIQHFDENHMNAHNLACIFAPNLLRSKESSSANLLNLSSSEEYEVALQVIEFLLNHKDKFCITSQDIKPFQLCNKIDGISSTNLNSINSLSLSDFPTFKRSSLFFRFSSIAGSSKNINIDNNTNEKEKSSHLKNEIKGEEDTEDVSSKASQDPSSCLVNNNIPSNKNSVTFSETNIKANKTDNNNDTQANPKSSDNNNDTGKDADTNVQTYHPSFNNQFNNGSPALSYTSPSGITIKSKSNLEYVRKHSEDSFYTLNSCALVSTSLNRLNYPLIKNKNYYEYLTKDNDNITPAIANEKVASPTTTTTTTTNIEKQNETVTSPLGKESISVASFNKSISLDEVKSDDEPIMKKTELSNEENDIQNYPPNVINTPQKNRDRGISFISPLSTPTKPVFCVPPPPSSPPLE